MAGTHIYFIAIFPSLTVLYPRLDKICKDSLCASREHSYQLLYKIGDSITLTLIRKKKFIEVDVELQVYEVPVEKMYQDRTNPMGAPKK